MEKWPDFGYLSEPGEARLYYFWSWTSKERSDSKLKRSRSWKWLEREETVWMRTEDSETAAVSAWRTLHQSSFRVHRRHQTAASFAFDCLPATLCPGVASTLHRLPRLLCEGCGVSSEWGGNVRESITGLQTEKLQANTVLHHRLQVQVKNKIQLGHKLRHSCPAVSFITAALFDPIASRPGWAEDEDTSEHQKSNSFHLCNNELLFVQTEVKHMGELCNVGRWCWCWKVGRKAIDRYFYIMMSSLGAGQLVLPPPSCLHPLWTVT